MQISSLYTNKMHIKFLKNEFNIHHFLITYNTQDNKESTPSISSPKLSERNMTGTILHGFMFILFIFEKHKLRRVIFILKDAINFKFTTSIPSFDSIY